MLIVFTPDISNFEWIKYNPNKPAIPRDCINVTSLDGELDGYGSQSGHTYSYRS